MIQLTDEVEVMKATETDSWGISADSNNSTIHPARIFYNHKRETLNNAEGETIVFTATVYFDGLTDVGFNDSLKYIDDFGDLQEKDVITRKVIKDFAGKILFTKVLI
ncbi:hypothetical protein [Halobacillus karajensis]|uniref:hypothetical protein n=1 Tax=Halobacillus karajensis TaxID=195088 RepID=UPI00045C91B0|nr:hypothetical protein [Halobacillus karajensis]CDQ21703.1 hypothetical protein BN982_04112 [Halobacillus karajensis]